MFDIMMSGRRWRRKRPMAVRVRRPERPSPPTPPTPVVETPERIDPPVPRHDACVAALAAAFAPCRDRLHIRQGQHLALDGDFDARPTLALVRNRPGAGMAVVEPGDVLLVVEVTDSGLSYQRLVQAPAYARAGVGELWVVGLEDRLLEVYTGPADGNYHVVHRYQGERTLAPAALPGCIVSLAGLLG